MNQTRMAGLILLAIAILGPFSILYVPSKVFVSRHWRRYRRVPISRLASIYEIAI